MPRKKLRHTSNGRWETEASGSSEKTRSPENIAKDTNGFGGISRRTKTCKPIIAAVEGGAHGGGVEILLNCDLVVSDDTATFALPEVRVGVVASSGGKSRSSSLTWI